MGELYRLLRILLDKQLTSREMKAASEGHYRKDNEIIWMTGNRFISRRKANDNEGNYVEIRFYDNNGLLMHKDRLDYDYLA